MSIQNYTDICPAILKLKHMDRESIKYMHSYHARYAQNIKMQKTSPISLRYNMEMEKTKDRKNVLIEKLLQVHINLGHAVVQLVETLCYKPEGRGFNSR
jgi:hypothetical protein